MCCDRIVHFVKFCAVHDHKRTAIQGLYLVGAYHRHSVSGENTFARSCMPELFVPRVTTRSAQKREKTCELRSWTVSQLPTNIYHVCSECPCKIIPQCEAFQISQMFSSDRVQFISGIVSVFKLSLNSHSLHVLNWKWHFFVSFVNHLLQQTQETKRSNDCCCTGYALLIKRKFKATLSQER